MSKWSNVGWSRRDFIRASLDATAAIALGSLPAFGNERDVRFRANPFGLGVASGDPHPDGVVLWARLDEHALDQAGALRSTVPVRWEVSEDERFRRIVQKGSQIAQPELGHSVHAEVEGLRPGRHYWYRFMTGGEVSPSGRTKTAPAETASLNHFQVRLCFLPELPSGLLHRVSPAGGGRSRPRRSPGRLHLRGSVDRRDQSAPDPGIW